MTDTWSAYRLDGCLFEAEAPPAPEIRTPEISLPDRIDLRPVCSPVEDQRSLGSCAANAIVGALEYHQRKAGLPVTDLSRLFVYYNARQLANNEDRDTGTFISHVMAAVLAHGACEARMWPYQESMVFTRPTEDCFTNARNYEAVQYARTPLGAPALTAVAMGLPVVFGTYLPRQYYDAADASGGTAPKPQSRVERPGSGHAMLIVGYDMTDRVWIVRNSWGTGWADGGCFRLPFETLETFSDPTHFWVVGAIEHTEGFALAGVSQGEAARAIEAAAPGSLVHGLDAARQSIREKLNADLESAKQGFRDRLRGPGAGGGYDK